MPSYKIQNASTGYVVFCMILCCVCLPLPAAAIRQYQYLYRRNNLCLIHVLQHRAPRISCMKTMAFFSMKIFAQKPWHFCGSLKALISLQALFTECLCDAQSQPVFPYQVFIAQYYHDPTSRAIQSCHCAGRSKWHQQIYQQTHSSGQPT